MKAQFSMARMMATALAAVGVLACLTADTYAANRTWTNASSSGSGNRNKWGTTSQFATNWSGIGNPGAADTAVFAGTNGPTQTNTIMSDNTQIGQITFSGTTAYTFQKNSTLGSLLINGNGSLPNVGISNNSSAKQTFDSGVKIGASNVEFVSTGAGSLKFTALDLTNKQATVTGAAEVTGLVGAVGSVYEAKGGPQSINFAAASTVSSLVVSGGDVMSNGDSSQTNLNVSGGNYIGGGVFKTVTITSGALDLSGLALMSTSVLSGTGYSQSGSGITKMDVSWDATTSQTEFSTVNDNGGGFTLGGGLSLDGSGLGGLTFAGGTTWNLFQGSNFTSGSLSPANDASNFSQFVLNNASSSPYNGAFTRYGQEWIGSGKASDGTYLVFQAQTGNLVVVPEPSTMVFAGLGVAMSGWTMWKKRRLSKLLAAEAS